MQRITRNVRLSVMVIAGAWLIALLGLLIIYSRATVITVDVGSSYARPYLVNFYEDEANADTTYAFTRDTSEIVLQGVGASSRLAILYLNGQRPAGAEPLHVQLQAGAAQVQWTPAPVLRQYHIFLPPASDDVHLVINSNTYSPAQDRRELGALVEQLQVQSLGSALPLTTLLELWVLLVLMGWYGLRIGLRWWQIALALTVPLAGLLLGLATVRLFITVALLRWIIVLLLLHLVLEPLRWLLRRVIQHHNLSVSPMMWQAVWAIFGVALLVKVGGVLYPHIRIFDEHAHATRVQWIFEGRFGDLYYPNYTSFMGQTVGLEGGYLPYSPLWYLIIAPFRLLGLPIDDTMNALNALLDVSKGLMIFVLALATLRRERLAVLASLLYHLLPMPYYLLSWGNYPTQFGLWSALLATTYLVLNYQRFGQRRVLWWWIGMLVLTILSYTVIGIFAFTMFGLVALLELARGKTRQRNVVRAALIGMLAAEAFVFAIYHVQFASVVAQETLPSLFASVQTTTADQQQAGVDPRSSALANIAANNVFLRNHTTDGLLLVALIGIVWLYLDSEGRRWRVIWTAWLGTVVLYGLVSALVADMVLKHMLFLMPLLCLGAALVANNVWERWRIGRWLVLVSMLVLTFITAERWYFYLLVKRH